MKLSKDPFEVAFEEVDDSPPDSPYAHDDNETQTLAAQPTIHSQRYGEENSMHPSNQPKARVRLGSTSASVATNKNKDDDDEEEDENMDVELGKFPSTGDPDKMAKMQ